jgi:hypothetical protein
MNDGYDAFFRYRRYARARVCVRVKQDDPSQASFLGPFLMKTEVLRGWGN